MNINKIEFDYTVTLLNCVISEKKPPEKPAEATFEGIYKKAKAHHVSAMVYYAIEQLSQKPQPQLMRLWSQERDKAIVRDINQSYEYSQLTSRLEENKIRYISLKGTILKGLYPSRDMRFMCDIDMICDSRNAKKIKEIMLSLGYEVETFEKGNHDAYLKKPIMNVEIHTSLFSSSTFGAKNFSKILSEPFENAEKISDFGYQMKPTYFFLHLLTHTAKHYLNGGIGLRSFMDLWLYYKNFGDEIDFNLIDKLLASTSRIELCHELFSLSKMWFGNEPYNESFDEMSAYIFSGGAFGTVSGSVKKQINEMGKVKYFFTLLFPSYDTMAENYPLCKKIPPFYPLCLIYRLLVKSFVSFRKNFQRLKVLLSKNEK